MTRRARRRPVVPRLLTLVFAGILVCAACIMRFNVLPVLKTMSEHQASLACTKMIHDIVGGELEKEKVDYDSLVRLSRNESGRVTAIETDILSTDRLKSATASAITSAMQNRALESVGIPLGTLLNSPFFNGYGPKIPFRIVPSSAAGVNIESSFVSAGINQTLHRISLTVTVEAKAIIPGIQTHVDVDTSFLIAETVVVGEIPGAFTEIHTNGDSLPNTIAGYGASSQALQ